MSLCLSTCLLKTMHCSVGTCRLPTQCVHVSVVFHRKKKKKKSCNLINTNCLTAEVEDVKENAIIITVKCLFGWGGRGGASGRVMRWG